MCTLRFEKHRYRRNYDLAHLGLALSKLVEVRDLGNVFFFFLLKKLAFIDHCVVAKFHFGILKLNINCVFFFYSYYNND